jgi:hypothetical protein
VKIDSEGEEFKILNDIRDSAKDLQIYGIVELHPDKMDVEIEHVVEFFEDSRFESEYIGDTTKPGATPRPAYYFSG